MNPGKMSRGVAVRVALLGVFVLENLWLEKLFPCVTLCAARIIEPSGLKLLTSFFFPVLLQSFWSSALFLLAVTLNLLSFWVPRRIMYSNGLRK